MHDRGAKIGAVLDVAGVRAALAAAVALPVLLAGCAADPLTVASQARRPEPPAHVGGGAAALPDTGSAPAGHRVAPLGQRVRPDLLVRRAERIPADDLRRLRDLPGVSRTAVIGIGSAALHGESVTVAAVDPSTYRVFAPKGTAESDAVWQRVSRGEAAVAHAVGKRLHLPLGKSVTLAGSRQMRVGAFATTVPGIDVVVSGPAGDRLNIPRDNGVVIGTTAHRSRSDKASRTVAGIRRILGDHTRIERLGGTSRTTPGTTPSRTAFLTGGDAAGAFGTFRYQWMSNGRLWIDPAFVRANIRTERVPVLGAVRCHRLMFPQLRGALQEVVDKGLASAIHPGQYGGCFVPKGIEGSPGAVSLHTWGIAIDLNVPENLRGTEGQIDRRVVAIFKKWGFAWGGDWSWTDPMHFEMAGVLTRTP